jgi:hypothetical protein
VRSLEQRQRHYERFFGPVDQQIMHSTDDRHPHIDIYQFAPHGDRDHWVLVTGGMSDDRQAVPVDAPASIAARTELMMYAAAPENWMFNVLKALAHLPFENATFLHWRHTIDLPWLGTADPPVLSTMLLLPPFMEDEDIDRLIIDGEPVNLLWVVPITDAELAYKTSHGADALLDRFEAAGVDPVAVAQRRSAV